MWDLPGSGIEPESPAWTGGFLTTEPSGKPYTCYFLSSIFSRFQKVLNALTVENLEKALSLNHWIARESLEFLLDVFFIL